MRIALDVSAVPAHVAGAGRYVVEIARRLPAAGVDLALVSRRDDAERWRSWSPQASVEALVPTGRVPRLLVEAWRLGTSSVARGATVWHGPHYTMPRRGSTPTVVTVHDLTFFTHPQYHEAAKAAFFQRAIRYAAAHAEVLVCVSEFTARQLRALVRDLPPIVVAPHGVDLDRFHPQSPTAPEVPYALFLGTIEPRKGLETLLEAFAAVAQDTPDLELWLAGQSGWAEQDVRRLLEDHPARTRIRRLGFVDDAALPSLLARARAVVYPSRVEGFGLPVLEAMACGAVVVTSSGTVMEEIADGAALLCSPGDAVALSATLQRAIDLDGEARLDLERRARQRAEVFTWASSVERHLTAYDLAAGR